MRGRTFWLTLALCAVSVPVSAQSSAPTRAEVAEATRAAKAARSEPYRPGKVERFLTRLEKGSFGGMFAPSDGFGLRIGGIESGSGLALGPSWRTSTLGGGNLHVSVSGARSIGGDTEADLGVTVPHVGSHRLSLSFDGTTTRLAQARFFGLGPDTERGDETSFALARDSVRAAATFDATRNLRLSAGAGVLTATPSSGSSVRVPSLEHRFTAADAPALARSLTYTTFSLSATLDYRDVPGNPRGGGRLYVGATRYAGSESQATSFTRLDTELEQHLSFWRRQRLITLRALATTTMADSGHEVPFYLQPTLGGSRVLRGFVRDRFRDQNVIAVQAEYAWDVLPFLSAVAFAEAGTTAARPRDLDLRQLKKDYGLGFRFGSARTIAFRTDVALGSGEGTRITMRFNHAF